MPPSPIPRFHLDSASYCPACMRPTLLICGSVTIGCFHCDGVAFCCSKVRTLAAITTMDFQTRSTAAKQTQ